MQKRAKTPAGQPISCYVIAHRVRITGDILMFYLPVQVLVLSCVYLFIFFPSSLLECTKAYEKDPCVEWVTLRENPVVLEGPNPNLLFCLWAWYLKHDILELLRLLALAILLPWCLKKNTVALCRHRDGIWDFTMKSEQHSAASQDFWEYLSILTVVTLQLYLTTVRWIEGKMGPASCEVAVKFLCMHGCT